MSEIIHTTPIALPAPTTPMTVRVATRDDMSFMDALQKKHSKALGSFSRQMLEGYIDGGNVLIAEATEVDSDKLIVDRREASSLSTPNYQLSTPLGYVISKDRYLRRDELGAIFQLCVAPGQERKFIAANLLKEVFERSSYGCRLYCCWCAQDLPANRFWEAMGFVPIAYRAGSASKLRVHIFWQKRIRAGDNSTPYWFPAKTEGGAIREDRIILPIPPGMKWTDELPVLDVGRRAEERRRLEGGGSVVTCRQATVAKEASRPRAALGAPIRFGPTEPEEPMKEPSVRREKANANGVKRKADPTLIAKARELRDRWLECDPHATRSAAAKYDLARAFETGPAHRIAA